MFSPTIDNPSSNNRFIVAIAVKNNNDIFLAITPHIYFLINIQQFLYLPVAT